MNLLYIQSEIFRELMGMETLFKPGCTWFITRNAAQDLEAGLFVLSTDMSWKWDDPRAGHCGYIRYTWRCEKEQMLAIKTHADLTAIINRIWDELPNWCKREDILK